MYEGMDNALIDSKSIYKTATMQVKLEEGPITDKILMQRGVRQGDPIPLKLFTLAKKRTYSRG